jgi:anti-sigma factor RsiW
VNAIHLTDEQLQAYLDGTLADADAVELHLETCPACRQALEAYRQLYVAIEEEAAPELSPDFVDRVMARLTESADTADTEELARGFRIRDSLVFVMAVIAMIAGAVYFINPVTLFRSVDDVAAAPSLADNQYLSAFFKGLSGVHLDLSIIVFAALTLLGVGLIDHFLANRRRHRKPISYLV